MKILYADTAQAFAKKCLKLCVSILDRDVSLQFRSKKLLYKGYLYPLHLVVFEGGDKLGYFNSGIMEIAIAKSLMFSEEDLLAEVIKHELAHLICFLENGDIPLPHGKEFKDVCRRYNWTNSISATVEVQKVEEKSRRLRNKIEKLFDLSNSANAFEAKSALSKAHELMIAHGIKERVQDDGFIVMRVLEAKRQNEKIRAISSILRSFFVYPVINHGKGIVYLEIFGERDYVEIADYIAGYLDHKFDQLWKNEKTLSGISAKTSFFQGIASGFLEEIKPSSKERGVLVVEKVLRENVKIAYPRLSRCTSSKTVNPKALKKGRRAGSLIKIPKGIKKSGLLRFLPLHKES